jgi:hypothetical protein
MRNSLVWLVSGSLMLGGCGPKKVLQLGLDLAQAGRTVEACEALAEGQLRFPGDSGLAVAAASTCSEAMSVLAAQADAAIAAGDLSSARHLADRALRLRAEDPGARALLVRVVGAHVGEAERAWSAGEEAQALRVASALAGWRAGEPSVGAWVSDWWAAVADRSVAEARAGRFAEARARLDTVAASMAGAAAALAGARAEIDRVHGRELVEQALASEASGALSSAWMWARSAAALDPVHGALAQRLWGAWFARNAMSVAATTRDRQPRSGWLAQQLGEGALGGLLVPAVAQRPQAELVISRSPTACTVEVDVRGAQHAYVSGTVQVPNPDFGAARAALDGAAASLRSARDGAAQATARSDAARASVGQFEALDRSSADVLARGEAAVSNRSATRDAEAARLAAAEARLAQLQAQADAASAAGASGLAALEQAREQQRAAEQVVKELIEDRQVERVAETCDAHPARSHWEAAQVELKARRDAVQLAWDGAKAELDAAQAAIAALRAEAEARGLSRDQLPPEAVQQLGAARDRKDRAELAMQAASSARDSGAAEWEASEVGLRRAEGCERFAEARRGVAEAAARVRAASAAVEGARPVDPAVVREARAERDAAAAALQGADSRLAAARGEVSSLRAAREQAAAGLAAARAEEREASASLAQALRVLARAEVAVGQADQRLAATPSTLLQQVVSQYPYPVELHTRTCRSALDLVVTVDGRTERTTHTASVSTADETWRGEGRVGLIGNALLFPQSDEQLADALDAQMLAAARSTSVRALGEALSRRAQVGPRPTPEQEATALLYGWQLGSVAEPAVSAGAQRLFGAGW